MKTRKIAADIYAVKKMGIDGWQDDFYWPVSEQAYWRLVDFIYERFDVLYEGLNILGRALVLSDSPFIFFLGNYAHAMAVQAYCENDGVELSVGPLARFYYQPNWEDLALAHHKEVDVPRWRFRVRKLAKNVKFNALAPGKRFKGLFRPDALGLGSSSWLKGEYARQHHLYVRNSYSQIFLRKCDLSSAQITSDLTRSLHDFLEEIGGFCQRHYGTRIDGQALLDCWQRRLAALSAVYTYILNKRSLPEALLTTQAGNPLNKIIAHAFQTKNKKTVAFHHGNCMGGILPRYRPYNDMGVCDIFTCPTAPCSESYASVHHRSNISEFREVRFVSTETHFYKDTRSSSQCFTFPEKIRRVMLIGKPMHAVRVMSFPGNFFAFHLDLELRLVRLLKKAGFEVLYKFHPESIAEALDVFEPICDKVLCEPFEEVWHEADALLFKFTKSSAFGFALCTNRPIFWIALERDYWDPAHYDLLRKRCHVIPAWRDERERFQFEQDTLLEKLSQKPEYPDFSYVKKYMFPQQ